MPGLGGDDLTDLACRRGGGLTGFAGTLPHDGCIDQRRWVLNSWGFQSSVHIAISGSRPFTDLSTNSDSARGRFGLWRGGRFRSMQIELSGATTRRLAFRAGGGGSGAAALQRLGRSSICEAGEVIGELSSALIRSSAHHAHTGAHRPDGSEWQSTTPGVLRQQEPLHGEY
jgi:hypothetical protein